ncbi:hypothetical protein BN2475_90164 [Paraburkholderia ribeironis]|uniref:Uncharacterized protein n=1 Tax=Paraburkholderia ribeironis TaxID=1247936 RepID=A0A1N7RNL7_9BURK|nr:hypothetical protein BN2475_90164 [Paraburkholderia ribeironis]
MLTMRRAVVADLRGRPATKAWQHIPARRPRATRAIAPGKFSLADIAPVKEFSRNRNRTQRLGTARKNRRKARFSSCIARPGAAG